MKKIEPAKENIAKEKIEDKISHKMNKNSISSSYIERMSTLTDLSSLPSSIRSTPRENPFDNVNKIDLTLSSKIKNSDIKETIIQLLTDRIFI